MATEDCSTALKCGRPKGCPKFGEDKTVGKVYLDVGDRAASWYFGFDAMAATLGHTMEPAAAADGKALAGLPTVSEMEGMVSVGGIHAPELHHR